MFCVPGFSLLLVLLALLEGNCYAVLALSLFITAVYHHLMKVDAKHKEG
jgi:hypothetical protein